MKQSIAIFFKKEYSRLVRYINKRIDDTYDLDSHDIIQEVMVSLIEKTELTIPMENLAAYIYRAVQNKIIDIFRRKKKKIGSMDNPIDSENNLTLKDILQDVSQNVDQEVEKKETISKLLELMDELSPSEKAVILAVEMEGRTYRDLAEEWDEPVGTLLSRKSRAIKKLQTQLKTIYQ